MPPATGSRAVSAATSTEPLPAGRTVLAIDIGGTKVAAAIVDDSGAVSGRVEVPTPRHDTAEQLLDEVAAIGSRVLEGAQSTVAACGVGCGGPMEGDLVSPLNIPAWRRFPLEGSLAQALGLAVAVDNDAKALALGEGWKGAARGARAYLAMVVSTGVGGGLVVDGRLLDGRVGNAGHVGHVIVEPDGRACPCGGRGCLEAEVAGPAIEALTGAPSAGAPTAVRARAGTLVGRAVASVANLLDLDLALVGGSVALGFGTTFFEAAQLELSSRARLDFSKSCRIVPVGLGPLGPLVGAGAVGFRRLGFDPLAP